METGIFLYLQETTFMHHICTASGQAARQTMAIMFTILLVHFSTDQGLARETSIKTVSAIATVDTNGGKLVYGKYGCTASKYRNGSYEFIPRGSFTINKNGKYTYNGFEKPSSGTFVVDKKGNLLFKGGYLDGGKAEKIDRPNKFFLVFPGNPDNRWTCTLIK
jgi:hypothetical protein